MTDRYWLKADFQPDWLEVSKETWIKAERNAGFYPKCHISHPAYMTTTATGGWSSRGVRGSIGPVMPK